MVQMLVDSTVEYSVDQLVVWKARVKVGLTAARWVVRMVVKMAQRWVD